MPKKLIDICCFVSNQFITVEAESIIPPDKKTDIVSISLQQRCPNYQASPSHIPSTYYRF